MKEMKPYTNRAILEMDKKRILELEDMVRKLVKLSPIYYSKLCKTDIQMDDMHEFLNIVMRMDAYCVVNVNKKSITERELLINCIK